tara:strand:- start:747 stop:2183 length:1437 start_codon:yes stop_codon:yes gene_type:complete
MDNALRDDSFFNPADPDFNSVYIGENRVRLSPHAPELRSLWGMFAGDDRIKEGRWFFNEEIWSRLNPMLSFFQDRKGQPVGIGTSLIKGENYQGLPYGKQNALGELLPILMQSTIDGLNQTDFEGMEGTATTQSVPSFTAGLAIDFAGYSSTARPTHKALSKIATSILGPQPEGEMLDFWEDLNANERDTVLMSKAARVVLRDQGKASAAFLQRITALWNAYDNQLEVDSQLSGGEIEHHAWVDEYHRIQATRGSISEYLKREIQPDYVPREAETEKEKAVESFYAIMKMFDKPEAGGFDSAGWSDAKERFLMNLDSEMRQHVMLETTSPGRYATPMVQKFRRENRPISQYYRIGNSPLWNPAGIDIPPEVREIWDKYKELGQGYAQFRMEEEAMPEGGEIVASVGMSVAKIIDMLKKAESQDRLRARGGILEPGQAPTAEQELLDVLLVRWRDMSPVTAAGEKEAVRLLVLAGSRLN